MKKSASVSDFLKPDTDAIKWKFIFGFQEVISIAKNWKALRKRISRFHIAEDPGYLFLSRRNVLPRRKIKPI